MNIGSGVRIGAQSGIMKDVASGASVFGSPALDVGEAFRILGAMRKLPAMLRRLAKLERESDQE
ncbi:hypothetical protein DRQ50_03010 [bacterium]|nr:MAG: hypothetical protein DRQ50_03010 [bacterium]